MNTLYIMHGLPGSGKSTATQKIISQSYVVYKYSTDDYWYRPDGYYDFNVSRLKEAHQWNFERFMGVVGGKVADVIIDNTNLSLADCRKYIDNWPKYGTIKLVEPDTDWRYDVAECFKRNTHRVPLERIQAMREKQISGREEILDYIYAS